MAYKFQTGVARLEGATTFEDALVGESSISASAALQGASLAADGAAVLGGSLTAVGIAAGGAISGATTIDASGDLTVGSITNAEFTVDSSGNTDIDGTLNVEGVPTFQAAAVFSNGITTAGAIAGATTVDASGLASLDGGIDVNGNVTVSTAGAIEGVTTLSGSGQLTYNNVSFGAGNFTVSNLGVVDAPAVTVDSLDVSSGGITGAGAIAGATTVDASGLASLDGGIDVNGSNFTVATDGDVSAAAISGSGVLSAASLSLDSVAVSSTAAELNYLDLAALGTGAASKALVFDANGNFDGASANLILTASAVSSSQLELALNALSINGTYVSSTAAELNYLDNDDLSAARIAYVAGVTAGTAIASKAVVLDASKDVTGINNLTASYFSGNGSGITNIDVSNLDATGQDGYIQFNQNSEFGANAGLVYSGTGSVVISGSTSGFQDSTLGFGTGASQLGQIGVSDDDGYIFLVAAQGGLDLSGSDGVSALIPPGGGFGVVGTGNHSLKIGDMDENYNVELSSQGVISGSGNITNLGSITSDGVVTSNAGLKAGGNSYGLFAHDLTRSAGDLTIKLHDASANQVNFRLAGGSMPLSVLSTGIVQMDATRIAIGTNAGEISGSGGLKMGGAVQLDGANDSVDFVVADSMYFFDAGTSQMRRDSWADVMSAAAGTGITATAGVLSLSAVSTPTAFGDADATMVEGLNYASATLTAARDLTLPNSDDLDVGEFVKIKMAAGVSSTVYADIVIAVGSGDLIDGDASIRLESPFAAVNLYKVAENVWRIL
jgi:hypothetical protein